MKKMQAGRLFHHHHQSMDLNEYIAGMIVDEIAVAPARNAENTFA